MADHFDISLFGLWPRNPRYEGGQHFDGGTARAEAGYHFIEPKTRRGGGDDDMRLLLNDLTAEMRAQYSFFKRLRMRAAKRASQNDEADQRAEVKAATDAIALIIRTLEKADELQRRLAAARKDEEERQLNFRDYDHAKAHFLDLIEQRAEELAERKLAGRETAAGS